MKKISTKWKNFSQGEKKSSTGGSNLEIGMRSENTKRSIFSRVYSIMQKLACRLQYKYNKFEINELEKKLKKYPLPQDETM